MKKKSVLLLFAALFSVSALFAQNLKVQGTVVDKKTGEELIGASVVQKGTSNGTITDYEGKFSISAPQNAVLLVSYIGYVAQEVTVKSGTMNIALESNTKALDEVVVVGYGTMKSKDLTSSITTVKADELMKTPAGQAMQSMQGKVAGLQVINAGAPGDQPKVRVRGIGSYPGLTDNNEAPLYVVDGMFFDNIDFLNSSDIASISILKDASAAAIYGVKAANGVILIETKSGNSGKGGNHYNITYNGYYGVQHAQNVLKMANAEQYTTMALESGSAVDAGFITNAMQRFGRSRVNPNVPDVNTDWYKEILRDAAIQNHSVDVSGGSDNTVYSLGANYFGQDGVLDMKNEYQRFNLRSKVDLKLSKLLSVGANTILSNAVKYNQNKSAWNLAYFAVPILPVYDDQNTDAIPVRYSNAKILGYRSAQNPMPSLDFTNDKMLIKKVDANFYLNISLIPNKLSFRTNYSHSFQSLYERKVLLPYNLGLNEKQDPSDLVKTHQEYSDQTWDNVLTYTDKIKEHNFGIMAGSSYRVRTWDKLEGEGLGFPTENEQSWYIDLTSADKRPSDKITDDGYKLYGLSYFSRLNYSYANRYLVYATLRADGSNKYQQKWGYFPAVGAGWVVSEENFWKSITPVNFLKLRLGWGQLGNENVPASAGLATAKSATTVFNGVEHGGYIISSTYSTLKWELTEETNIGLSSKLFNNRLSLEADYFIKDTKNGVISVSVPSTQNSILSNAGVFRNQGFEMSLNWEDKIGKDFSYNIGANFSTLKNSVQKLYGDLKYIDGGSAEFLQRSQVGHPLLAFYGYKVDGVYQNQDEISADPIAVANKLVPGDFKYKDLNGDKVLDTKDRTFLGSYFPTFMYGGNIGCRYKNVDLSVNVMGQTGNKILNRKRGEIIWTNDGNMDADLAKNRWHGEGTSNKYPSASGLRRGWNQKMSNYFVEDGSFFRIENITLGYTIKSFHYSGITMPEARITLTAEKPLTAFSYNGFNPEIENGIDTQTYPIPAIYTIGLSLKF